MTRLVGVRAVCDGCSAAAAAVFCVTHRNVLCPPCNRIQHNKPSTASHQRVDLLTAVTALPFCEHCDDAPATTYCESESSALCDKCDKSVHQIVDIPHWRTPIERTLRSRAVEFRVNSTPHRTPSPHQTPHNHDHNKPQNPIKSPKPNPQTPRFSPREKRHNGKERNKSPKLNPHNPSPHPPPSTTSPIPHSSKPTSAILSRPLSIPQSSAIRNQPTPSQSHQTPFLQKTQAVTPVSLAPPPVAPRRNPTQQRRRRRSLAKRNRDMQRLSQQQIHHTRPLDVPFSRADVVPTDDIFGYQLSVRTSQAMPYPLQPDLPAQPQSQPPPLEEPLLMDSGARYLDLGMMPYESLDLSTEATAIEEGLNGSGRSASLSGSAAESNASSRRKSPDMDVLPAETRGARKTPTQASLREVVASAVAAAGEQYLLNSVSSGSRSSRERDTPPVDLSCAPDPAGLVAAATAAAAAAQAAASVDMNNHVFKTVGGALTTDVVTESLTGRMRQPRFSRLKHEDVMHVDGGECERERSEGNGEHQLVAQMSDGDDVLRRGEEMGLSHYLDVSRDDFGGVFASIDLSQFEQNVEQNVSGTLGFGTGDIGPILDSDEG